MQRGNLIIYDQRGVVYSQTGDAQGDILPHNYPVGLPYIEIPFGTMKHKKLISINVSATPHEPIFETIEIQQTEAERILELENQLLLQADESVGGLL